MTGDKTIPTSDSAVTADAASKAPRIAVQADENETKSNEPQSGSQSSAAETGSSNVLKVAPGAAPGSLASQPASSAAVIAPADNHSSTLSTTAQSTEIATSVPVINSEPTPVVPLPLSLKREREVDQPTSPFDLPESNASKAARSASQWNSLLRWARRARGPQWDWSTGM